MAGRMYAISTVGSLLGTFLASLLLIPLVGTQRTFLTFALITAAVAALGLGWRWWLVPLAIAALMAVPVGTVKGAEDGERVLHEADTEYQYARVVEDADGDAQARAQRGAGDPLAAEARHRVDGRLLGCVPRRSADRAPSARRGIWRSSASAPAPRRAPTATTSRTR